MSPKVNSAINVIGIDIGKNSFHVLGYDKRGAIMLRQKWSRGQVEARLGLIGMEACVVHSISAQAADDWARPELRPEVGARPRPEDMVVHLIGSVHENESIYIPIGSVHRLANPGRIPLELIEVQVGSYLGEDDIVRMADVYGRVV
jgi:hypothetical protein